MNTTIRMRSIPFDPPEGKRFEEVVTVRRIVAVAGLLMVMSLLALGASTAQGGILSGWSTSFESAVRQSKSNDKPLMLLIAREGCPACVQMEATLSKSINARALSDAVRVRVESTVEQDLSSRFAAGGTPTIVIFASGNYDTPVYTYTGVMDGSAIRQLGASLRSMARNR